MNADFVVRAQGVARTFGHGPTAVVAVHGISCAIRSGEHIVLVGTSGSGKSTLLHLLAGLDRPTAGTVDWPALGDIDQLRPGPVAVVFQGPSLLPALDAVENVELPLLLEGADRRTARSAAIEALHRLGLEGIASKLPEELSGGQSQRVAIARVLAGRPRFILADEPTGQLDQPSAVVVIDALVEAASMIGAALIVNTHDLSIAERFPVRWSMGGGRLVQHVAAQC